MHIVEKLEIKLNAPLPGFSAQYEMAPLGRAESIDDEQIFTKAAVLCLLYQKKEEWHVVFIERTSHEKDKHSAQIAFPGGKMETDDKSHVDAALREANEEVGLVREKVNIIGPLSSLKIPVSGFEVFPILAYASDNLDFIAQPSEVQRIIEIPLESIMDSANKKRRPITLASGFILNDVPIFEFEKTVIWGATAMMLNELVHLLDKQ